MILNKNNNFILIYTQKSHLYIKIYFLNHKSTRYQGDNHAKMMQISSTWPKHDFYMQQTNSMPQQ